MIRESRVQEVKEAGYDLFTPEEAACLGKVSLVTVYRHIEEGKIKVRRIGVQIRIERRDLFAWLDGD